MNINRNNYEEYFLLYADNELSQAEKIEVEIFVKQHVDLEEEFRGIQLTINIPDESVSIADKSFLMKNNFYSFINENNFEEVFVLYHDNELSNEQKNETEEFVKQHPQFNIEFELIGKAKLAADTAIVFPDKKLLYKKEKAGRVIPLIFWKSIAAAVFIGVGLWTGFSYYHQKEEGIRAMAFDDNTIKTPSTTEQKIASEKPADKENTVASSAPKTKENATDDEVNDIRESNVPAQNEYANILKKELKNKSLPEENTIQIKQENNREIIASNDLIKNTPDQIVRTKTSTNNIGQHIDRIDESIQPATSVQNASYASDNNNNDENYVFYNIKADKFNKSKVGSFLKKVKRIAERTNPIGRLLLGEDKQIASK